MNVAPARPTPLADAGESERLPETTLALRFFALALVAACGVFLSKVVARPGPFCVGLGFGALCSLTQYFCMRRTPSKADLLWILPAVATWTFLLSVTGSEASALFVGYFLEVLIGGLTYGSAGIVVATGCAAIAVTLLPLLLRIPYQTTFLAPALGFLLLVALLTAWLVAMIGRQTRQILEGRAANRRRAESLAEELRLLGDYLGSGLLAIDSLGRAVSLNRAGAELLGVPNTAVAGKAWQELLVPDAAGARELARVIPEGLAARDIRFVVRESSPHAAEVSADVWSGPSPEGPRTYVRFGLLMRASSDGSDPLQRLGEAAACVSHQIKNSLHALEGMTREIASGRNHSGLDRSSEHLLRALGALGELSEDVLAMSGSPREPESRLSLLDVIASAVVLTRRNGVHVEVRSTDEAVFVRAHRGQLVHALFNLIDNACRAAPHDVPVVVTVRALAGRAQVEICDHGPGMPCEAECGPSRPPSRANGHGYGLVAARRFLESFGGAVEFERPEDGGTRCRVLLQRSDALGVVS